LSVSIQCQGVPFSQKMEFNSDFIEDEDEYKKEILDEVDTKEVVVFQVSGEENWNQ